MKSATFLFYLFLTTLTITLTASILWQKTGKTRIPQKKKIIIKAIHRFQSYYKSNLLKYELLKQLKI